MFLLRLTQKKLEKTRKIRLTKFKFEDKIDYVESTYLINLSAAISMAQIKFNFVQCTRYYYFRMNWLGMLHAKQIDLVKKFKKINLNDTFAINVK